MRLRHVAAGCALTGVLGLPALSPASAIAAVSGPVPTGKPQVSVNSPATDNPYGARVTLTVTLGSTIADREVSLYATPVGQPRRLVATGSVDAKGKWYPTYTITRTLYAHARVASRLTGYYKTVKSGGIVYDVFHSTGTVTLDSTVAPNKHGECLEPETEQYDKSAGWHADNKYGCDKLDAASHDSAPFGLSAAAGGRYRIRGDYQRGAKDTANLNQQGPWLYFIVTK